MRIADPIVLVADDCEYDALLMETVFQRAGFVHPLRFVCDGEQAIAYLEGTGSYANRILHPLPSVLLLDLKMPRKDGFQVLAWIRDHPALGRVHVYVLSASGQAEDIRRAYELGARSYLVKPGNLDGLTAMARTLLAWTRLNQFGAFA
jgi:CheY-like chemotaxis protein